jgi:hypothetical protein
MHSVLHKLRSSFWKLMARRASNRRPARVRLALETLEDRTALSTLFLVPDSTPADATHFHSFQDAYGVAVNGDVIQVEPGASVRSVGTVVASSIAGGQVGSNSITISQRAHHPIKTIGPGEVVEVFGGGSLEEDFVVTAAQYIVHRPWHRRPVDSFQATTILTLDSPFLGVHNAGATVKTVGTLGISKSITLQGDPNQGPGEVDSDVVVAAKFGEVTFDRLQFNGHELDVLFAAHGNTVTNCTVGVLTDLGFNNRFDHNTLGATYIDADEDQFTNNLFTGGIDPSSGQQFLYGLWIDVDSHDALVQGNTFSIIRDPNSTGPFEAILSGGQRTTIGNNTITVANADNSTTGIFLYSDLGMDSADSISAAADVENNVISTAGSGTGLEAASQVDAVVSVKAQGNDFQDNAIGVDILGDGTSAGNVDLGGGALGSLGQNNFLGFTPERAAAGDFAVSLHRTAANDPSATVFALNNLWSVADPTLVVRDGSHNTTVPENSPIPGDGTGLIIVSQSQGQPSQLHNIATTAQLLLSGF